MLKEKLISSKALIAELISDYDIQGTDWITKVYRHIARGMQLMRIDGYFVVQCKKGTVVDYKYILPCDRKYLLGVACISDEGVVGRIPLKSNFYLGAKFGSYPTFNDLQATVDGNFLITTFESGTIGTIYFGLPLDSEGYPMIIDNPFVMQALPFFIIKTLGYSGYKHPVITREEAEAKWLTYSMQARNDVNFPSIEEMQSFTEMNTNPYYEYVSGQEFEQGLDDTLESIFANELLKDEAEVTVVNNNYSVGVTLDADLQIGWILYGNLSISDVSPFVGVPNVANVFPINDDVLNSSQAVNSLLNIIDGTTKTIIVNNTGDAFIGRLSFKIITPLASRTGSLYFDIGDGQIVNFNDSAFASNANAGEVKDVSIVLPFYQLDTFATNGAKIMIEVDGDFSIYDVNLFLNKTYNGS